MSSIFSSRGLGSSFLSIDRDDLSSSKQMLVIHRLVARSLELPIREFYLQLQRIPSSYFLALDTYFESSPQTTTDLTPLLDTTKVIMGSGASKTAAQSTIRKFPNRAPGSAVPPPPTSSAATKATRESAAAAPRRSAPSRNVAPSASFSKNDGQLLGCQLSPLIP